jgi:aspartate/glutamate racemase
LVNLKAKILNIGFISGSALDKSMNYLKKLSLNKSYNSERSLNLVLNTHLKQFDNEYVLNLIEQKKFDILRTDVMAFGEQLVKSGVDIIVLLGNEIQNFGGDLRNHTGAIVIDTPTSMIQWINRIKQDNSNFLLIQHKKHKYTQFILNTIQLKTNISFVSLTEKDQNLFDCSFNNINGFSSVGKKRFNEIVEPYFKKNNRNYIVNCSEISIKKSTSSIYESIDISQIHINLLNESINNLINI